GFTYFYFLLHLWGLPVIKMEGPGPLVCMKLYDLEALAFVGENIQENLVARFAAQASTVLTVFIMQPVLRKMGLALAKRGTSPRKIMLMRFAIGASISTFFSWRMNRRNFDQTIPKESEFISPLRDTRLDPADMKIVGPVPIQFQTDPRNSSQPVIQALSAYNQTGISVQNLILQNSKGTIAPGDV